jgi:hypothetical protein
MYEFRAFQIFVHRKFMIITKDHLFSLEKYLKNSSSRVTLQVRCCFWSCAYPTSLLLPSMSTSLLTLRYDTFFGCQMMYKILIKTGNQYIAINSIVTQRSFSMLRLLIGRFIQLWYLGLEFLVKVLLLNT